MDTSVSVPSDWVHGAIDPSLIRDECLHQVFEESVDWYPDQVAIDFGGETVTYAELESRANALAWELRSLGVEADGCVGLCLPKSIDLYVGMLAILKAGGAYVPIDPAYPIDRKSYILENSGITVLVSTVETIGKDLDYQGQIVDVAADRSGIDSTRLSRAETGVGPMNLAYVIYTSGSTGKPKGVMIEHRGICHLVRASQGIYGITASDRVYQGISVAFDFSLEELWTAFSNGATLVPATPEMTTAGPRLSEYLSRAGITVMSCVPTLLAMMEEDVPTLWFINVGGEDCPQSLIAKWSRPGRKIFNTYGPTETSVNATYAVCEPTKKVTIGRPLPNFSTYILDEDRRQVPPGAEGELYIGGIGLARGYFNRPDLTAEKFVVNPFSDGTPGSERLYRSGDLVRFDDQGEIIFLGRIDTQVKIRGFRIELSEIESVLSGIPGIQTAIASVYEASPGVQSIVAYVVADTSGLKIDIQAIRTVLRENLPAYMMPQYIETLESVPQTPNGKIDRKNLPKPVEKGSISGKDVVSPRTHTERILARTWEELFGKTGISAADHFFYDLGGHSLFAAKMISQLRSGADIHQLSVADLYAHPTIESLAAVVDERRIADATRQSVEAVAYRRVSSWQYLMSSIAQFFGVYFVYFIFSIPLLAFYLIRRHGKLSVFGMEPHLLTFQTILILLCYTPVIFMVAIAAKWLIIGRYRPGEYPLWGWYYFRFWLVKRIQGLAPLHFLEGTPLMAWYLRAMGARVGRNCSIGTTLFQVYDGLTIGNDTSIGVGTQLLGYTVEDGLLKIGTITVGAGCFVGTHSVIGWNTVIEDEARLDDQSLLSSGSTLPRGQYFVGSPAVRETRSDPNLDAMWRTALPFSRVKRCIYGSIQLVIILLLPLVALIPYLTITTILFYLYHWIHYWVFLATIFLSPIFVLMLALEIGLLKKIVMNGMEAGTYHIDSLWYVRKWLVDRLMAISLLSMNTLFATLYTPPFLRMLGARIGKRVEVSTVTHISPGLLEIQDESFVADMACLGAPRVYAGRVLLASTTIGTRTFIGNAALVPVDTTLGNDCLIGVMSTPPHDRPTGDGTSWLGLPPMFLPKRDVNMDFSDTETYHPTRSLYVKRYAIEFFRATLPTAINLNTILMVVIVFVSTYREFDHLDMALFLPALIFGVQLVSVLIVALLKWVIVGRYVPRVRPLWSTFVWRTELITGLFEDAVVAPLLHNLLGTPFAAWILRLFGVKIGNRVYLDTTFVTEFDLVKIGSESAINFNASLQTHLFEDRVMKMSYVDIGERCFIGSRAVVLYDTRMHDGAGLHSLSLLMKGESLPADTRWEGAPAQPR